jgi:hypothetical protein
VFECAARELVHISRSGLPRLLCYKVLQWETAEFAAPATVSPHAQEVEYALILSRMIRTVKKDRSQLRLTIYEFARARLKIDTYWADETERKRLSAALETAIQGAEEFSAHREEREQLEPPVQAA